MVRTDGSCLRQITTDPSDDLVPAWDPTGQRLTYTSDRDGRGLYTYDLATGSETRLDVGDLRAGGGKYSPDGSSMVFAGSAPDTLYGNIYKVSVQDGAVTQLTHDAEPVENGEPAWSPDGSTIYYVSTRTAEAWEIHSMAPDGTNDVTLTTGSDIIGGPAVSPDGKSLAYSAGAPYPWPLMRLDLASGTSSQLTAQGDTQPAFDPTGNTLAVSSNRTGDWEVFLIDATTGADVVRLTNDPSSDVAPAFSPVKE